MIGYTPSGKPKMKVFSGDPSDTLSENTLVYMLLGDLSPDGRCPTHSGTNQCAGFLQISLYDMALTCHICSSKISICHDPRIKNK
eukprot:7386456-Prymnesium_polylepis.1